MLIFRIGPEEKATIKCTLQYARWLANRRIAGGVYTEGPIRVYL